MEGNASKGISIMLIFLCLLIPKVFPFGINLFNSNGQSKNVNIGESDGLKLNETVKTDVLTSHGDLEFDCETRIPRTETGSSKYRPQLSRSPFNIVLNTTKVRGGDRVRIVITARMPHTFKKFSLQVLPFLDKMASTSNIPQGKFLYRDPSHPVDCYGEDNTFMYSGETNQHSFTLVWEAPARMKDYLFVWGTFMQNKKMFWTNVRSSPLVPDKMSPVIERPGLDAGTNLLQKDENPSPETETTVTPLSSMTTTAQNKEPISPSTDIPFLEDNSEDHKQQIPLTPVVQTIPQDGAEHKEQTLDSSTNADTASDIDIATVDDLSSEAKNELKQTVSSDIDKTVSSLKDDLDGIFTHGGVREVDKIDNSDENKISPPMVGLGYPSASEFLGGGLIKKMMGLGGSSSAGGGGGVGGIFKTIGTMSRLASMFGGRKQQSSGLGSLLGGGGSPFGGMANMLGGGGNRAGGLGGLMGGNGGGGGLGSLLGGGNRGGGGGGIGSTLALANTMNTLLKGLNSAAPPPTGGRVNPALEPDPEPAILPPLPDTGVGGESLADLLGVDPPVADPTPDVGLAEESVPETAPAQNNPLSSISSLLGGGGGSGGGNILSSLLGGGGGGGNPLASLLGGGGGGGNPLAALLGGGGGGRGSPLGGTFGGGPPNNGNPYNHVLQQQQLLQQQQQLIQQQQQLLGLQNSLSNPLLGAQLGITGQTQAQQLAQLQALKAQNALLAQQTGLQPRNPLLTSPLGQNTVMSNQFRQSPLIQNQITPNPLLQNQFGRSQRLGNQLSQNSMLSSQHGQTPFVGNQFGLGQNSLLTSQQRQTPLIGNQPGPTTLLNNQLGQNPLLNQGQNQLLRQPLQNSQLGTGLLGQQLGTNQFVNPVQQPLSQAPTNQFNQQTQLPFSQVTNQFGQLPASTHQINQQSHLAGQQPRVNHIGQLPQHQTLSNQFIQQPHGQTNHLPNSNLNQVGHQPSQLSQPTLQGNPFAQQPSFVNQAGQTQTVNNQIGQAQANTITQQPSQFGSLGQSGLLPQVGNQVLGQTTNQRQPHSQMTNSVIGVGQHSPARQWNSQPVGTQLGTSHNMQTQLLNGNQQLANGGGVFSSVGSTQPTAGMSSSGSALGQAWNQANSGTPLNSFGQTSNTPITSTQESSFGSGSSLLGGLSSFLPGAGADSSSSSLTNSPLSSLLSSGEGQSNGIQNAMQGMLNGPQGDSIMSSLNGMLSGGGGGNGMPDMGSVQDMLKGEEGQNLMNSVQGLLSGPQGGDLMSAVNGILSGDSSGISKIQDLMNSSGGGGLQDLAKQAEGLLGGHGGSGGNNPLAGLLGRRR